MRKRVVLSWSSGKDSAWALHVLRQSRDVEVIALLTTFNRSADRVAMHAVRRDLVRSQARAVGLPLWEIDLPWPCANEVYERLLADAFRREVNADATHVAYGDLFLEDVRQYREQQMNGSGLEALFPLWGLDTKKLAREMVQAGLRAKLTCVNPRRLGREFAGRDFDEHLLADLPVDVDPCGERGEFHTFVYDAPGFAGRLAVRSGDVVERDGFVFADVVAAVAGAS